MDNLLLAALKSETAPSRDAPGVRDRSEVGRDRDPSAFDRELNETARERRDARADRSSERTEHTRASEHAERAETARSADQAERADTDATDRTDDATTDGTRDPGAENTRSGTTESGQDKAEASANSAREGADAATPDPVTTAAKLSNLAKAVAEKLAKIDGTAEAGETDTDAITDPVAGPSAVSITAAPANKATPAAGLAVSPGTGGDATSTDAAGRAKSAAGQTPLDIETSPDGKRPTGNGGDGDDNRPGAKPGNAPERALAARAAFGIAGAERAGQTSAAKADFAQSLGASRTLDGITGDGLRQADTQTVTLRLTPVSHASKLSAVPVNTLAFHIARSFDKGINHFQIRLDPPELGRIDVRMEVDGESRVRVHLVVERPEALDFLQRDARALERALADAGLDADAESLSFSLDTGNPGAGGEDDAALGGGSHPGLLQPGATDEPALVLPTHYVSSTGVDIRV